MKKLLKVLLALVLLLALVAGGLVVARNQIIRTAIIEGAKQYAGVEVKLDGIDIGLAGTYVKIDKFTLMQPPGGFGEGVLVDLPEVYADYELKEMLADKVHLTELRINMAEVHVVKNKDGKLNLEALVPPSKEEPKREEERKSGEFLIDRAVLSIGRVRYTDMTTTPPKVYDFQINLKDEELRNIRSIDDLRGLVMKILLQKLMLIDVLAQELANVGRMLTHSMGEIVKGLGDVPGKVLETVKDVPGKAGEVLKDTTEGAGKVIEKGAETVKDGAEKVLDGVKGLFGPK